MIQVRAATPDDVRYVIRNMRAEDAEESLAPTAAAREDMLEKLLSVQNKALKNYVFFDRDGQPAALLGAYVFTPREAYLHRCATARFAEVALAVFGFGRSTFVPDVLAPHVERAFCRVLEKHARARAMLLRLGFVETGGAVVDGLRFSDLQWDNPSPLPRQLTPLRPG